MYNPTQRLGRKRKAVARVLYGILDNSFILAVV